MFRILSTFLFLTFILTVPLTVSAADFGLQFNGTDNYVDVGNDVSLNLGSFFEISMWVKTTDSGSQNPSFIGRVDVDGNYEQYWYIGLASGGRIETSLGDGTNYSQVFSTTVINDGAWHYIVWTRSDDLQTIYVDDVDRTNVNYIDGGIGDVDPPTNLIIGGDIQSDDYYFNGILDEISIFTNSAIQGSWNLDEGSGGSIIDSSGNNNSGTISGATWVKGYFIPPPSPAFTTGGPTAYRPEVSIIFPRRGDVFSSDVVVEYEVTDKNDDKDFGKEKLGLGESPVSLFYSETTDIRKKNFIEDELPAINSYKWNTEDLLDGNSYMVIVEATDKIGEFGQGSAGPFSIDQSDPIFTLEVTPLLSRGENIIITVSSSKILKESPTIFVTQQGLQPVEVLLEFEDDKYIGTYAVFNGYDGTAVISVLGTDKAGNVSTSTVGGNTFSINVAPPPQPVVTMPINNDVFLSDKITVLGRARSDTAVLLFVNGKQEYRIQSDKNGDFIFTDVTLDSKTENGVNFLSIVSVDGSGVTSEEVTLKVVRNSEPEIVIVSPQKNDVLFTTATIKIGVRDSNEDLLSVDLEVSRDGETWFSLVNNLIGNSYVWDTTKYPDNDYYLLRVTADDGFVKKQVISERFSISNFQAKILFLEEITYTNNGTVVVLGTIEGIARRGLRTISTVEYSLDQGKTWAKADPKDAKFDSYIEDFTFKVSNLKEGAHSIIVRGEDKKGSIGAATKTIVVDTSAPPSPVVVSPEEGTIISDALDLDENKAGVQIMVRGNAESNNTIIIQNNTAIFEGKSDKAGQFAIELTLREPGTQTLEIVAYDLAGNISKIVTQLTIIYNNPPILKILWPREKGGLNHVSEIVFEIQDRELDVIQSSSLSYRRIGEERTHKITQNMNDNTFIWDVSDFEEGIYELILQANDGGLSSTLVREFTIDNTKPIVKSKPLLKNIITEAVEITAESSATDDLSGVEYVEYSVNGENWYKAVITDGYREESAESRFIHPSILPDGKHNISFRATDVAGNVSDATPPQEVVIDTSPPRIGSYTLSSGPFLLLPEGRSFKILENSITTFVISLEQDTEEAILTVAYSELSLTKNLGLWTVALPNLSIGIYPLFISAKDIFGSEVLHKNIGEIKVVKKGRTTYMDEGEQKPIEKVIITVEVFNEENNSWSEWSALSYGLENPVFTDEHGMYSLLLPAGKYQIFLKKDGFSRAKSVPIELKQSSFITSDFILERRKGIRGFLENILEKLTF